MAISRTEILSQYKTESRMGDVHIVSSGKFEGEPIYVVALWDASLEQGQDDEVENDVGNESPIYVFFIDAADRKEFPELKDIAVVTVWETSNGFIHHKWFPSRQAYEKAKRNHEAELERDHPVEEDDDGTIEGFEGHSSSGITTRYVDGEYVPAINVKPPPLHRRLPAKLRDASQEILDSTFEQRVQEWWENDAPQQARIMLDKVFKKSGYSPEVRSDGRSNGHLVVTGLPEIEAWSPSQTAAWHRFEKAIKQSMKNAEQDWHKMIEDSL